jgi:hypothetical protein
MSQAKQARKAPPWLKKSQLFVSLEVVALGLRAARAQTLVSIPPSARTYMGLVDLVTLDLVIKTRVGPPLGGQWGFGWLRGLPSGYLGFVSSLLGIFLGLYNDYSTLLDLFVDVTISEILRGAPPEADMAPEKTNEALSFIFNLRAPYRRATFEAGSGVTYSDVGRADKGAANPPLSIFFAPARLAVALRDVITSPFKAVTDRVQKSFLYKFIKTPHIKNLEMWAETQLRFFCLTTLDRL